MVESFVCPVFNENRRGKLYVVIWNTQNVIKPSIILRDFQKNQHATTIGRRNQLCKNFGVSVLLHNKI